MREWLPHVTVATVVEQGGRFLLVEERDKQTGDLVFNQPAGHLEAGETLAQAAVRETLEETGWNVELTAVLGIFPAAVESAGTDPEPQIRRMYYVPCVRIRHTSQHRNPAWLVCPPGWPGLPLLPDLPEI